MQTKIPVPLRETHEPTKANRHKPRPVKFLLSPSRKQEIYCEYGRGHEDPALNKEVFLDLAVLRWFPI